MIDSGEIAAPKSSPPTGTPPKLPGSIVVVKRSLEPSSFKTAEITSGTPIPKLTILASAGIN